MRRAPLLFALGLLGCGPPSASADDEINESASTDESGESESTESGESESTTETESTSTTESTTETDTESDTTTGEDLCPETILGMLEIDDETDLATLACLVEAQWIYIEGSFTDLSFLSKLEVTETLRLREMPALTGFAGLDSLHQVDSLGLRNVPNIVDLSSLHEDVQINTLMIGGGNDSLVSIAMPPGGATHLIFSGWDRTDLEILATASPPPTFLEISGAPLLEDLEDVAACCLDQQASLRLWLSYTPLLTHLQGLEAFTELSWLLLGSNPNVESLAGLQNLEAIHDLDITNDCDIDPQAKLVDLTGLENLVELDSIKVQSQGALVSLEGLPTQLSASYATFIHNTALEQPLIDAWLDAVMLGPNDSTACDNLNGWPCEGNCPQ
jgi:hypothetical protein